MWWRDEKQFGKVSITYWQTRIYEIQSSVDTDTRVRWEASSPLLSQWTRTRILKILNRGQKPGHACPPNNDVIYQIIKYWNWKATSLSFIGLFVGAGLAGFCSDKFGRKITITISVFFNAVFWLLQAYMPGYTAFVVIRILVQAANQAAYLTYVCYSCEVVGPSGRKGKC